MTCKAYNGRVVAAFLSDRACDLVQRRPTDQELQLVAGCLIHGCRKLCKKQCIMYTESL